MSDLTEALRAQGMGWSDPNVWPVEKLHASRNMLAAADLLDEIEGYARKASGNAWGGDYGRGIEIAGDAVLDLIAEHERGNVRQEESK